MHARVFHRDFRHAQEIKTDFSSPLSFEAEAWSKTLLGNPFLILKSESRKNIHKIKIDCVLEDLKNIPSEKGKTENWHTGDFCCFLRRQNAVSHEKREELVF